MNLPLWLLSTNNNATEKCCMRPIEWTLGFQGGFLQSASQFLHYADNAAFRPNNLAPGERTSSTWGKLHPTPTVFASLLFGLATF